MKTAYNDNEVVKMKRLILLIVLVVLVMILAGLPASAVSNSGPSFADSNIPDNDITTSQTEASNSSASATITITMTEVLDE
jgi:flagellar basal body-associated protein FliL